MNLLQRKGKGIYQLHPLLREFFAEKGKAAADNEVRIQAVCQAMVTMVKAIPKTPTLTEILQIEPNLPHLEEVATALRSRLSDEHLTQLFATLSCLEHEQGIYKQATSWSSHINRRVRCCKQTHRQPANWRTGALRRSVGRS